MAHPLIRSLLTRLFRNDLPVTRDVTGRFLPWVVLVMVFLASLGIAGAMSLQELVHRWSGDMSGVLTVQIPPAFNQNAAAASENEERVERAVRLLRTTNGVISAEPLSDERVAALLQPWLGSPALIEELPTPRLIDVQLRPEARPDLAELAIRLADAVPGAIIDDHLVWLSKLIDLARGLEKLAWLVIALVTATTAMTVIYATRTSLAVHRPQIEVLHFIGATDNYIAGQFARRGLWLGLAGGVGGLLLTLPALWTIGRLGRNIYGGLVPQLSLSLLTWSILLALPFAAALIAMLTARVTVRRQLARML